MKKTLVSIVVPMHNSEKLITNTVVKIIKEMRRIGYTFELIIAEDGCTDKTPLIAKELSLKYNFIRHFHSEKRLGRGLTLKLAFPKCKGNVLVYMDDDLATDLKYLKELIDSILVNGYDVVTGSRLLPKSKVLSRKFNRKIASV
jgi:glycosyltransferase involved in cell wall biosynthesis